MSPTPAPLGVRRATPEDRLLLSRFLNSSVYTHRHLDWREPLEWLGYQPFWMLEKNHEVQALLACPPEPEEVAWVHAFSVGANLSPSWAWNMLFERIIASLSTLPTKPELVSLGMHDWFSDLLQANHFTRHQDIVVLAFDEAPPPPLQLSDGLFIREMLSMDLPAVLEMDNLAFESIWRLSRSDITRAYEKSTYKTVALLDNQVIGYQMSALSGFSAHLARLAVLPGFQHRRIGFRILQGVLDHFINQHGTWGVTLNTQNTNHSSLALYKKVGFHLTGEQFPVYIYPY
jgi:[ribosomal protein S18]-alanine N-acetyltransferase